MAVAKQSSLDYSVVVPLYNEAQNVSPTHKELLATMDKLRGEYEIIYINDGSKDATLKELKKLKKAVVIDLNRNYGQSTALDAGFKAAQGEIIISLDGDLQNDPADIPRLLEKLKKDNLDVIAGWRRKRRDKNSVRILTRLGRACRGVLLNDRVHDSGCMLRAYRKEAVKSLDLQGEMHRYILALLRWKGFRIGELEVNHRPRIHGNTKYSSSKAVRGFIDLMYIWFINKYSQRPLHLFGYLSLLSSILAVLSLGESIAAKIIWSLSLNRNGFFYLGFFFFIASILFFSFGIIIDILIRIHHNSSPFEQRYYVREIVRN